MDSCGLCEIAIRREDWSWSGPSREREREQGELSQQAMEVKRGASASVLSLI
jgi:hypothetical protein